MRNGGWAWWVGLCLATHASAAGFGFETGAFGASPIAGAEAIGIDVAANARFGRGSIGSVDLRTRFTLGLGARSTLPDLMGTVTTRFRTLTSGSRALGFNLAVGGGVAVGLGCMGGDVCGASVGPAIEVSPALEARVNATFRPYLALNAMVAVLMHPGLLLFRIQLGVALGIAWDFGPGAQPNRAVLAAD